MKKWILLCLCILWFSKNYSQIVLDCPTEDVDTMHIVNHQIIIDTTALDLEIINSRYDKLYIKHSHQRYKTSFYELDTIALIKDEEGKIAQITFLMCDKREFVIDNPYIENSLNKSNLINRSQLIIGDWYVEKHGKELEDIVSKLNSYITDKGVCNQKRYLHKTKPLTSSQPDVDFQGYYYDGIDLPGLDGQNSIEQRNKSIQNHIDTCLHTPVEDQVVRLSYTVNEEGRVEKVLFDMYINCSVEVRNKIEKCMLGLQFEPARYKGKKVKSKCHTLIGVNTDEKYPLFKVLSKQDPNKKKEVEIPDEVFEAVMGLEKDESDEVHFVVDQKPELINPSYFKELEQRLSEIFPDESFDERFEFIVEKDGSISKTRIAKQTNGKVAQWIWENLYKDLFYVPGQDKGKVVRVKVFGKVSKD